LPVMDLTVGFPRSDCGAYIPMRIWTRKRS
jgi:hypothetical protein